MPSDSTNITIIIRPHGNALGSSGPSSQYRSHDKYQQIALFSSAEDKLVFSYYILLDAKLRAFGDCLDTVLFYSEVFLRISLKY